MKRRSVVSLLITAALAVVSSHAALAESGVTVSVPGTANVYLAGQPNGTCGWGCPVVGPDCTPDQSPVSVEVTGGSAITISATGSTSHCPGCTPGNGPDGRDHITAGADLESGLSQVTAPFTSLIGVFLGNAPPDPNVLPPELDFSKPALLDASRIAPAVQQVFFIGDGLRDPTGSPTLFHVPAAASQLFLGSLDGLAGSRGAIPRYAGCNINNTGAFQVTVSETNADECRACPEAVVLADVSVSGHDPDSTFGNDDLLRVDYNPSWSWRTFIRAQVTGLGNQPPLGASLRFHAANWNHERVLAYAIEDCSWDELTMTWNNMPVIKRSRWIGRESYRFPGKIADFDVTKVIVGDGVYCFLLYNDSHDDVVEYFSREAPAGGPELLLTAGCPCGDVLTTTTMATSTTTTTIPLHQCSNWPNGSPCDDGNACSSNDRCMDGYCVGGPPTNCDDGDRCTDDACDPWIGCISSLDAEKCDDGNDGENPDMDPVTVTVPGTANVYLAGQPEGTCGSDCTLVGPDCTPDQSPVVVDVTGGSAITISASGSTSHCDECTPGNGPDGREYMTASADLESGLSQVTAPINSLIGVFLGSGPPDSSLQPSPLNVLNPSLADASRIAPGMQQLFFIGDGLRDPTGSPTVFHVPAEATRLFLGSHDGTTADPARCSIDNTGAFQVTVRETNVPECRTCPEAVVLADVSVFEDDPDDTFWNDDRLELGRLSSKQTFIRVQVTGLGNQQPRGASLRLHVAEGSRAPVSAYAIEDCSWDELTTWNNRPPIYSSGLLDTHGKVYRGKPVDLDVTRAIVGDGTYCFALDSPSKTERTPEYFSREAPVGGPELLLTVGCPCDDNDAENPDTDQFPLSVPGTVSVPGTANVYLAGQPNDTCGRDCPFVGPDCTPDQSPVVVDVPGGSAIIISASGSTSNCSGCQPGNGPDGRGYMTARGDGVFGLSQVTAPLNSLIGVFLGNAPPDPNVLPPPHISFLNPSILDAPGIAPAVQQVFFIGDGLRDPTGNPTVFYVPPEASRLFLGSLDGLTGLHHEARPTYPKCNINNTGAFQVTIHETNADVCRACPEAVVLADVSVLEKDRDGTFGDDDILQVDRDSPKETFIRAEVTGLGDRPPVSASLRLHAANESDAEVRAYVMEDCTWDELTTTWNNRPTINSGGLLDTHGDVYGATIVDLDVTRAIVGDGTYCFALNSSSSEVTKYSSRERSCRGPELLLTVGCPCGDVLTTITTSTTSTTTTTTTTTIPLHQCANKPNGSRCDDRNACTSDDGCMEGECVGGAPTNCDDRDPCTDDACDPSIGCISSPNSANCNDGAEGENPDDDLGDNDNDGVVNYLDLCAGTPAGDLVGGDGCSICNCKRMSDGNKWSSRRAYGRCIKSELKRRRVTNLLTRKEMRAVVKRAKKSTCGTGDLTRCCFYPRIDKARAPNVGRCRIMPWKRCAKKIRRHGRAEDLGPGSCLPNPCTY